MSVEPYDFRKPGRLTGDVEQRLAAWLSAACALVAEKWAKHLPFQTKMSVRELKTAFPSDAIDRLPNGAVGYCVSMIPQQVNSLLAVPRPLVLALATGMLGDTATELPADRALSAVEESLYEYLLQHLLTAIEESWAGAEPLGLRLDCAEPQPKRTRLFAPTENLVVSVFAIQGPFGEQEWYWLLPKQGLLDQLTRTGRVAAREESMRPRLETIVQEMSVELSVTLGVADLCVSQLTRLQAGDLVLLDQRVTDPLEACVAGATRFRVWPGRVGPRQAFQIESLVEC